MPPWSVAQGSGSILATGPSPHCCGQDPLPCVSAPHLVCWRGPGQGCRWEHRGEGPGKVGKGPVSSPLPCSVGAGGLEPRRGEPAVLSLSVADGAL